MPVAHFPCNHFFRTATAAIILPALLCLIQPLHAQDSVADHMLVYQRSSGGWPKHLGNNNVDYSKPIAPADLKMIREDTAHNGATIDNNATTKEIRYLLQSYKENRNKQYLAAAEHGIRFLLTAQYRNGGWPQYYPDSSLYRSEITYNDNAMVNVLNLLDDLAHHTNGLEEVNQVLVRPAQKAVENGIGCILKTQLVVNGKLTAWCAQYDKTTLLPDTARAYELPSLSGNESVGIVRFLMRTEHPSPAISNSVNSAVAWFEKVRIPGYKYVDIVDASLPDGKDRVIQPDPSSVIWARFYEISTNEPFFCGRDGIKKKHVAEVAYERRTNYGWYGTWPKQLLEKDYPAWKKANP